MAAHAGCQRAVPPEAMPGSRNARDLQTHTDVHASLESGLSLCETGRRLGLALNTVKRYAAFVGDPAQLIARPSTSAAWWTRYRDHLRTRRANPWPPPPSSRRPG